MIHSLADCLLTFAVRAFCDFLYLCSASILCIYTQHQSNSLLP
ncbi:hypothetical protein AB205_0168850 [Aquarana catesbeiana]|uniref:Uncharacterized protein n=1 Tax=Aquarana catesbeiana TaxID=8400 RepID=A0A2G9S8G3_AQUCT|nr:hypothetical protein AB205_0168850 [Aquarana catesbeiana]